ncbi:MAG: nucleotide excision repair endonuclease, partial [Limisphaerales bacterium]
MTEKQLRLFAPPKPLFETFGSDYFRKLPKSPAVYRMYDQQGRLIYVGQSKNLRQRLNSYRYVHPDRSSRKLVRLVHSIATIEYELCDSETAAKLRENELLRQFRPRFNSLNTWPKAHCFIGMHWEPEQLTLSFTRETPGQTENYFGAFKSGCLQGYMALLRLLWILGRKSDDAWS